MLKTSVFQVFERGGKSLQNVGYAPVPSQQCINGSGKCPVFIGYGIASIVCGKVYFNLIVGIAPIWMMVVLFGQ